MPTLEERVGHLEQEVAAIKTQLTLDRGYIKERFDTLTDSIEKLDGAISEITKALAALAAGTAVNTQQSSTTEKIIFAVVGVLVSAATFVVGKLV